MYPAHLHLGLLAVFIFSNDSNNWNKKDLHLRIAGIFIQLTIHFKEEKKA